MKKLIEALNIFLKYGDSDFPTHCEHDVLYIVGIEPSVVSEEDIKKLDELGFHISEEHEYMGFYSYRYGSA